MKRGFFYSLCVLFIVLCAFFPVYSQIFKKEVKLMELTVKSSAFVHGGMIPSEYTCDGRDISPPLSWSEGPERTKGYALISDDPDAPMGTWVHWVMYNISPDTTSLAKDIEKTKRLSTGALQGKNDFGTFGYGGPCPPSGTHRYYFKVYALDIEISGGPGLTKKQLLKEMDKHIIAQGALIGTYTRR